MTLSFWPFDTDNSSVHFELIKFPQNYTLNASESRICGTIFRFRFLHRYLSAVLVRWETKTQWLYILTAEENENDAHNFSHGKTMIRKQWSSQHYRWPRETKLGNQISPTCLFAAVSGLNWALNNYIDTCSIYKLHSVRRITITTPDKFIQPKMIRIFVGSTPKKLLH